ncbi:MAG: VCBS repeat-containing protein, partial [Planctomycetes bacterium]|nr:VCBS repeat-containing protein [Planctomycetota bacterium]
MLALASRILVISLSAATLTAQWHVSPNGSDAGAGTPADPFRTINHAAAVAAPGETLHLQAGVFADEQGIVDLGDKDLVLQGAGVGATFLRPHTTLTAALPPALTGGGAAVPYRVGVLVDGAARVHLRDLTIDAQAQASAAGHLAGVYVRGGADVVVDRCRLRDCRAAAPGGGRTHAFVVHGDAPVDPSTLACRLVEVVGFGDGGVFARLRAELDLQECLLVGRGRETVAEQVAVAVVDDAQLQLRASRIAACGGAGGAAVRLLQPTTGCRIDANRVTRCAFGIDIEHQPPSIVPGTISHNRISSVDTALRLSGVSGWSVFGNALLPVSRFDPAPFSDDTAAGNAWHGNRYPVLADGAAAPLAVPGGGNVDAAPLAGSSELRELTRVPCGGAPVSVVTADFDGDGREDFATLDLQGVGASLTVALWRPTGHQVSVQAFGGPATRPVRLVVGEFDEDPGTDLVALLAPAPPATGAGAFWVFGNDGAGALAPLHQQPLAGFVDPCDVANVRLNGDGRDDLVIVDRGAPLLLAGGGATFVNSFGGVSWLSSPLPGTFSTPVTAVAAGDLDGDAIDDVAVVSGGV